MTHDIQAIAGGYHGDPFRVLGPHRVEVAGQPGWEVRAFLPHASEAWVLLDGEAVPMRTHQAEGFFTALLRGEPRPYRLRAAHRHGGASEFDDPYRFPPVLTDVQVYLHGEGTNTHVYDALGAHPTTLDGVAGVSFAVWAPHAVVVSVVGDFNGWDPRRHPMRRREGGLWEIFIPGVGEGAHYKYLVRTAHQTWEQWKSDPFGFYFEKPPQSAAIVWNLDKHQWNDKAWMEERARRNWLKEPISIYEVHLESWLRGPNNQALSYRELAVSLVAYVKRMGFTHIELLPILEHPFSGSWGYQVTGYYAPTSRFGPPEDFMYLVDACHQAGIGVILDWVPGHFPRDAFALARFDGTALYEHLDPRQGEHKEWGTLIFNFGRNEVRQFLIGSALFWLRKYHIDGLRVDAVASMLYLDYSRRPGEWIPNRYGGRENLEAIDFLRRFNELAHQEPGVFTIAEESTSFPAVTQPVYLNGLGFTMKWNMGWMHDMLSYFSKDPIYRKFHQNNITFSLLYAFSENFLLPISHDEVVHMKGSLIGRMPGDEWRKFAGVRAFLGYMFTHPGKKLLFMGCEIGQYEEWNYAGSIRWELLAFDYHRRLQAMVSRLNHLYRTLPPLYEVDYNWQGFEWIDFHDSEASVISFVRRAQDSQDFVVVVCNFTPQPRERYRIGMPEEGDYMEILNTDDSEWGGSGVRNHGRILAGRTPCHGRHCSVELTLPPMAVLILRKVMP